MWPKLYAVNYQISSSKKLTYFVVGGCSIDYRRYQIDYHPEEAINEK